MEQSRLCNVCNETYPLDLFSYDQHVCDSCFSRTDKTSNEIKTNKKLKKLISELDKMKQKREKLTRELKNLEQNEPNSISAIWRTRDRLAYAQGKIDGIKLALDVMESQGIVP